MTDGTFTARLHFPDRVREEQLDLVDGKYPETFDASYLVEDGSQVILMSWRLRVPVNRDSTTQDYYLASEQDPPLGSSGYGFFSYVASHPSWDRDLRFLGTREQFELWFPTVSQGVALDDPALTIDETPR
ncbi:hypothetical protein [Leifsonia shinshuensis]|uniref:Uncharacterized protein n=1 Tax=Leifsonia shinshuensis TaxID=150026 RepID=A0A853CYF4_9MICO|nr:hypothetical protein [Leifsonia shinshuensis]NYJ23830.1 hypothetical protein [Leifsonia shinshuensis]